MKMKETDMMDDDVIRHDPVGCSKALILIISVAIAIWAIIIYGIIQLINYL